MLQFAAPRIELRFIQAEFTGCGSNTDAFSKLQGFTALEQLSNAQCNDLLEITEDRYGQSSTIVVSQFPVDKWHGLMENPTTADAILDRLVHNSHRVVLQGESLRKNPPTVESSEKTS
ncbi:transposase subunit [Shigella sonnei]|nr:transposase subunit [Shigella sonnei]